jgi:sortase B
MAANGRGYVKQVEEQPFPSVDWEYWQGVNPDVIAWVTVPGTRIDYAVVQAPDDDPTYYLYHDIYRDWNPYGCPYVDASCEGVNSPHTVIFGHNMISYSPSMFGDFSQFSNAGYAAEHPVILLQTPDAQMVLDVSSVSIVRGSEQSKRTDFADAAELAKWYEGRFENATVQLANNTEAEQLFTFVTCSYNYFSNERTLVCSQPQTERTYL